MAIAEKDIMQQGEVEQQPDLEALDPVSAPAPAAQPAERVKRSRKQSSGALGQPAAAPDPVAASDPQPVVAPMVKRVRRKLPIYVYWMLLGVVALALLLIGGFWLVLHPEFITNNINQPYALLFGPALVVSALALWLIIKFFAAIERGIKSAVTAFKAARQRDEGAQFFWLVIAVFLMVSVFASGDFFSKLEHEAIPGLGYASAFVIDLVAVVCMRARLSAGRMRDKAGQTLYLVGVLICAGISAFANLYTTLTTFNTAVTGSLPPWMADVAPWFGLAFPALIVLLSLTADYTLDQTSSKLDPEAYRVQESKRVRMRQYQRDLLRERVEIERDIDDLSAQLFNRKEKRVFFLVAWLFPLQMNGKQLLKRVEELYQPQIAGLLQQNEALLQQNEALRGYMATLELNAQGAYGSLFQALQALQGAMDGQRDTDNRLIVGRIEDLRLELAQVEEVEDLRREVRSLAPATQVEELAGVLRQEMSVLAPASWVEGLGQEMRSLAPVTQVEALASTLRQEMRSLSAGKMRVNYAELARSLAPLLTVRQGLHEVNSEVRVAVNEEPADGLSGDTEEMSALNVEALTALNDEVSLEDDEAIGEVSEAEKEAWLQQPSVSIKQAAAIIGKEPKYVRTLRDRGTLVRTPRNKSLIATDSLKAYLARRVTRA